jgi:hypothetical protein
MNPSEPLPPHSTFLTYLVTLNPKPFQKMLHFFSLKKRKSFEKKFGGKISACLKK